MTDGSKNFEFILRPLGNYDGSEKTPNGEDSAKVTKSRYGAS